MRLLVVGGKRLGGWRRTAARLGLADAVRFVGPVDDVLPYYAAADVYVHPTIYDTCSLVVLEAAACGLPVVTTRCNGAAELFHDGDDIHLIAEPGDDAALAARIATLLDPAARRATGAAARQTAMRHTFEENVDEIIALYKEVVHRHVHRVGEAVVWSARVRAADASTGRAVGTRAVAHGVREKSPSPRTHPARGCGVASEETQNLERRLGRVPLTPPSPRGGTMNRRPPKVKGAIK